MCQHRLAIEVLPQLGGSAAAKSSCAGHGTCMSSDAEDTKSWQYVTTALLMTFQAEHLDCEEERRKYLPEEAGRRVQICFKECQPRLAVAIRDRSCQEDGRGRPCACTHAKAATLQASLPLPTQTGCPAALRKILAQIDQMHWSSRLQMRLNAQVCSCRQCGSDGSIE